MFILILLGMLFGQVVLFKLRLHISLSTSFSGRSFSKTWFYYFLLKIFIKWAYCFCYIWCRIWSNTDKKDIKNFCNRVFVHDYNFFDANVFTALTFALKVTNDLIPLQNFKCLWNIFWNIFLWIFSDSLLI